MVEASMGGPVILDLLGLELQIEEHSLLLHPQCGGVILFARNYESVEQVTRLTAAIKSCRPELVVYVDQEGGRVQRMRDGFLKLPPLSMLGELYDNTPENACQQARHLGWLMASECLAVGVDVSFAPVLDLDYANSKVIGDRAFHASADGVSKLAEHYVDGMHAAGMAAVGKHFPGHGYVAADSHTDIPIDERDYETIAAADLLPFKKLIEHGIDALMPAHVIYSQCDPDPAGFSSFWIQQMLRMKLSFDGTVFSDDLTMEGASCAGESIPERANAALGAGCDVVLVCNDQNAAQDALDALDQYTMPLESSRRHQRMKARQHHQWDELHASDHWRDCTASCTEQGVLS